MFNRILTCVIYLAASVASVYSQDENVSVDKEHILGVIDAHITSLEGWKTGDVLIRYQSDGSGRHVVRGNDPPIVEGPDALSVTETVTRVQRLVFDFDKQRALVLNRSEFERQVFDSLDNETGKVDKRVDDRAALVDHQKGHSFARLEAGLIHRPNALPTLPQLFYEFQAIPIKALGITPLAGTAWGGDTERRSSEFFTNESIKSLTNVGRDRYQVLAQIAIGEDRRNGLRYQLDWDLVHNVPVRVVVRWGYSHEDLPNAEPITDTSVKWTDINGNRVPSSARLSNRNGMNIDGRPYHVSEEVTIDLHWFSFNEDLPDELFDEQILHDRKKLDELLDVNVFEKKQD